MTCLMDSMHTVGSKKETKAKETVSEYEYDIDEDEEDENDDSHSGAPRLRCILCTTAASWDNSD